MRRHIHAALDDPAREHARNNTPGERPADEAVIGAALGHQGPAGSFTLTSNGQGALATAILVARQRAGVRFAVEEWTFPHAMRLLRQFGAEIAVLPMDASGLLPEALEEAARAGFRVLYAMPTMHNPLGVTMTASRRTQVAGLAARFDMAVIEDDAYAFLDGAAPAPLQALVPERTLRVLSLSKILSLTLRLGALVHPAPLRPLVTVQARSLGLIANPVMASAAAELAAAGAMEALIARKRQEGAERQALARSVLGPAFEACDAAWYGMLRVSGAGSGFAAQARKAGLVVTATGDFRADGDDRRQVRVSLGGEASRARALRRGYPASPR